MRYVSTRGEAPALGFRDVVLAGLARDGGLYVPESWPQLTHDEIAGLAGRPYPEVALRDHSASSPATRLRRPRFAA